MIVEGLDDSHFFRALFLKFRIPISKEQIKVSHGKPNLKNTAFSFINYKIDYLIVAEDLDTRTVNDLFDSWKNSLTARFSEERVSTLAEGTFRIKKEDAEITLTVLPMGLPEDSIIKNFAIDHFMMEDYLVRILLSNPEDFFQILKFKITNSAKLKNKISEILSLLREQHISVNSSKDVLTLMRVLLCDMPPHTFIEKIIEKTNKTTLESVLREVVNKFKLLKS